MVEGGPGNVRGEIVFAGRQKLQKNNKKKDDDWWGWEVAGWRERSLAGSVSLMSGAATGTGGIEGLVCPGAVGSAKGGEESEYKEEKPLKQGILKGQRTGSDSAWVRGEWGKEIKGRGRDAGAIPGRIGRSGQTRWRRWKSTRIAADVHCTRCSNTEKRRLTKGPERQVDIHMKENHNEEQSGIRKSDQRSFGKSWGAESPFSLPSVPYVEQHEGARKESQCLRQCGRLSSGGMGRCASEDNTTKGEEDQRGGDSKGNGKGDDEKIERIIAVRGPSDAV